MRWQTRRALLPSLSGFDRPSSSGRRTARLYQEPTENPDSFPDLAAQGTSRCATRVSLMKILVGYTPTPEGIAAFVLRGSDVPVVAVPAKRKS